MCCWIISTHVSLYAVYGIVLIQPRKGLNTALLIVCWSIERDFHYRVLINRTRLPLSCVDQSSETCTIVCWSIKRDLHGNIHYWKLVNTLVFSHVSKTHDANAPFQQLIWACRTIQEWKNSRFSLSSPLAFVICFPKSRHACSFFATSTLANWSYNPPAS